MKNRSPRISALAALLVIGCSGESSVPRPPRVILISMDTVRADRVSGYGSADTTPRLAAIAREGVLFRDSYGASTYTIPSTMSIFTGLDPLEHGLDSNSTRLSPDVPLLAELLQEAGYRTQAFQEGGYVDARFGFDRGFEEYRELPRIATVDEALPEVLAWMREQADQPYFLFLHTYAAHFPYGGMERYREAHPERGLPGPDELGAPREVVHETWREEREAQRFHALCNYFAERREECIGNHTRLMEDFPETEYFELDVAQIRTSYDERIARIDAAIGGIQTTLVELGQWEDTLLVVVSDHGEAFFEHGLERHDYVPFNECLRVPLVISYPRRLRDRPGHLVEGLTWHLDIMPTILGLTGIPAPPHRQGRDLTAVLLGRAEIEAERAIFPAVQRPAFQPPLPLRRIAMQGSEKWVQGHIHFGDREGFLFDLAEDPGERRNLRSERRARFDDLGSLARAYEKSLRLHSPVDQRTGLPVNADATDLPPELTEEGWEKLRSLGYVGDDE
jgi:arylsulfatase A-like enzyme